MHAAIERIGALLPAGRAAEVVEITEYAFRRVDKAMGQIDDSSGWFSEIVSSLERLHHDACVVAKPDPVNLARRLFAFEIDGDWDILVDSVEKYADVLGDDGTAEMRRLAEERWAELPPPPKPGAATGPTPPTSHASRPRAGTQPSSPVPDESGHRSGRGRTLAGAVRSGTSDRPDSIPPR